MRILENLIRDIHFSIRTLSRQPLIAIVIVLALGLGIGGNIAVFNVANALFLRPLAVPHPEQLVRVYAGDSKTDFDVFSYPNYLDLRDRSKLFSGIAAHGNTAASATLQGIPENLAGEVVSGNYFNVIGIQPSVGRFIVPSDGQIGDQGPVVVISHNLWKNNLMSDPAIAGRIMHINGHPFTIVGVAPESFHGSYDTYAVDFWAPLSTHELVRPRGVSLSERGWGWLKGTARLKPGIQLDEAQAEATHIAKQIRTDNPGVGNKFGFWFVSASALPEQMRQHLLKAVGFLALIAGAVLLVACANVASILLSRVFARAQEIGIRYSLGAGRLRLMSLILTETCVLAFVGGLVGIVVASWVKDGWTLMIPPSFSNAALNLKVDRLTLIYALFLSFVAGFSASVSPLFRIGKMDLNKVLHEESRIGRKHSHLFGALVIGQISVCTLLLIVSMLLLRSMEKSISFDPGFNTKNLIVGTVDLKRSGYSEEQGREYFRKATEELSLIPEVSSVSYSLVTPLGNDMEQLGFRMAGQRNSEGGTIFSIDTNSVGEKYFETMGIPIAYGRDFDERDMRPKSKPVAIINQTMAKKFWGNENVIGKTIEMAGEAELEVIGVVRDIKYYSLAEPPRPYVYTSIGQFYSPMSTFHVRTSVNAARVVTAVKNSVEKIDRNVAIYEAMTFEEVRSMQLFPIRALAIFSTLFGLLALILTTVGIYGVVSYSARRRTHEIGVRMALGATRKEILKMILGYSMILSVVGIAVGWIAAVALTRFLSGILFGVKALDPISFLAVCILLMATALTAGVIPARQASRTDPAMCLRYE